MSNLPKVSVVIPVYNAGKYLQETLDCLYAQTFPDFEIICVNDGSEDDSLKILQKQKDKRIVIIDREHSNAGACRNAGLEAAKGEYVYFFDADDRCMAKLLELTVKKADETGADIVGFQFRRFFEDGTTVNALGVHLNWLPEGIECFNYKDCPGLIMSVLNPTPWNKIYRRSFLEEFHLRFEEISAWNDITFGGVTGAYARKISYVDECLFEYRVGHTGTITEKKYKNLDNAVRAVESAERQVNKLEYAEEIKDSRVRFTVDNLVYAFENNIPDYTAETAVKYYKYLHYKFNGPDFSDIQESVFSSNPNNLRKMKILKNTPYEVFIERENQEIILSLTSYPARIGCVPQVIESLNIQERPASRICLWLAEDQFPEKEGSLPEKLVEQIGNNMVELHWCDNLMPHKKYFYTMRDNPDAIVITVDDDMVYDKNLVKDLFLSYLEYPKAVSACRSHLMIIDEEGKLLPYGTWIRDVDGCLNKPSMQLFATGVGGILYPPHIMNRDELFNVEAIRQTCLRADDIWLKAIELISDIPVVQARRHKSLNYIPGSQDVALYKVNLDQSDNDIYWQKVSDYFAEKYGRDIISEKLSGSEIGERLIGVRVLSEFVTLDHKIMKREINEVSRRLKKAYADKSEINRKLQITYKEKFDRGVKIKELEKELKMLKAARPLSWIKKIVK